MKKVSAVVCLIVMLITLTAIADGAWKCPNCSQRVSSILGDICPYCGEHNHQWIPATCTEAEHCACGKTRGTALGHQWNQGNIKVIATCISTGTVQRTCSVCQTTVEETLPIDPGSHSGATEICGKLEPTCTKPGHTGDTWCKACGKMIAGGAPLPAFGHRWLAATCTAPKTCSVYNATEGAALGHSWQAATCTQPKTCSVCGTTEGKAAGHQWNQEKLIKAPTCTSTGMKQYICAVCHTTIEEIIPIDSSNHSGQIETRDKKEATCTEAGYTGDTWCHACGKIIHLGASTSPSEHHWAAATCTVPKTCSVCGTTEGAALGHTWQDATCTQPKTCSICGETEGKEFGHKWDNGKVRTQATCRTTGVMEYTCQVCNEQRLESISINPKNHEGGQSIKNKKDPTCTEAGFTGNTYCTGCQKLISSGKEIAPFGHKWKRLNSSSSGTCVACGADEADTLFKYSVSNNEVIIAKYIGNDIHVTIPEQIHGKKVTTIGNKAFDEYRLIESIVLPDSITTIGEEAFHWCKKLVDIQIPSSVTSIGRYAFCNCGIESITVPNTVKEIGNSVFYLCDNLTDVTLHANLTEIPGSMFSSCGKLTSVTLPKGLTAIGRDAFEFCSSLTDIEIPSSVKVIDEGAFSYCSSLTHIELPRNMEKIGESAFEECTKLSSIVMPEKTTHYFGRYAFKNCTSLTSITLPRMEGLNGNGIYDSILYGCTNLTNVTIPSGIDYIHNHAFARCSSLTTITIPNTVKHIGYSAFYGCSSLTSITIPNGVQSLARGVFESCTNLKSVKLPKSLSSLDVDVFRDCSKDLVVTVPKGSYALKYCKENNIKYKIQ